MSLRSAMIKVAKRVAAPLDIGLSRLSQSYEQDRATIFARSGINMLFDIGANSGQYARSVRASGYIGRIVSVEPIPLCFGKLEQSFSADARWRGVRAAAGSEIGVTKFNVSEDFLTSSVLPPSDELIRSIPTAKTKQVIDVDVITADALWLEEIEHTPKGLLVPALKIDVQGFEKHVMDGARQLLSSISILEIELSISKTYENGYNLVEGIPYILDLGFELVSIGRGHSERSTGHLADADMLFKRKIM